MDTIICPVCGREVLFRSERCPHCKHWTRDLWNTPFWQSDVLEISEESAMSALAGAIFGRRSVDSFVPEIAIGTFKEAWGEHLYHYEQQVLIRHFGLDGKGIRTYQEIGEEYHLPPERIRQVETRALRKLRRVSASFRK